MEYAENVRRRGLPAFVAVTSFDSKKYVKSYSSAQITCYINEFLSRGYFVNTLLGRRQKVIFVETRQREKQQDTKLVPS